MANMAVVTMLLCVPIVGVFSSLPCSAGSTERVSVASSGEQGKVEGHGGGGGGGPAVEAPAISPDGRFVAFCSLATNLVLGDTTGGYDAFVRDRLNGVTERVSVSSTGEQADGWLHGIAISADGRFVVFSTLAANLVPGDTNSSYDVFLRDRQTGTTERVSVGSAGEQGDGDSGYSDAPRFAAPLLAISADGRFIAFTSSADNLVAGDTNGRPDVFVRDRLLGNTERTSVSSTGQQGNADFYCPRLSADGRFVAFCGSESANITPGDTNGYADIFVRDRELGTTERVSLSGSGEEPNRDCSGPAISADGRFVSFSSPANNLVTGDISGIYTYGVFMRDRLLGTTERVSLTSLGAAAQSSGDSSLSADGRFVAFASRDMDVVPEQDDDVSVRHVFVRDRADSTTELVSVSSWGEPAGFLGCLYEPSISADGRFIAFAASADNLVSGDTNDLADIFVRDREGFADVLFSHWAFNQITACVDAGIVSGYEDGTYHPWDPVTRDQMAVYISRGLAGGDAYVPTGPAEAAFPDVDSDHWAYDYVEYAASQSVVAGYDDGLYHPEYEVTRDQMAVYVARAMVAPTGEAALADYVPADPRNFPDVATNFWAYKHIEYCVENGVVQGYLDGSYHPEAVVTRDQMAVYVARAFDLLE